MDVPGPYGTDGDWAIEHEAVGKWGGETEEEKYTKNEVEGSGREVYCIKQRDFI